MKAMEGADEATIAHVIDRFSTELSLDPESRSKIRRNKPLPAINKRAVVEAAARTVLVENLPADASVESLKQLFESGGEASEAPIGEVKLVRMCAANVGDGGVSAKCLAQLGESMFQVSSFIASSMP